MRVLLGGASGLIGSALKESLHGDGHETRVLVRREPRRPDEVRWNPGTEPLRADALDGVDAVVNLSGAAIATRWTDRSRAEILDSRLGPTRTLVDAIVAAGDPAPRVLLSASAVGYYGDTANAVVEESHPAGEGFMADVSRRWEEAATGAAGHTRVVILRTGLVLSRSGGLLGPLRLLVRAGLGGRLGDGRQFQPWVSLYDHVAAQRFLIDSAVAGPVNVTGPVPVRQDEFIRTLGRLLHRPTILPAPGFALRLVLDGFAEEGILHGQRAVPAALEAAGFEFTHSTLEAALGWALHR